MLLRTSGKLFFCCTNNDRKGPQPAGNAGCGSGQESGDPIGKRLRPCGESGAPPQFCLGGACYGLVVNPSRLPRCGRSSTGREICVRSRPAAILVARQNAAAQLAKSAAQTT